MQISKVVEDGRVYARTEYEDGAVVMEKADPTFSHDAPAVVQAGAVTTVTFTLRDFDGEFRNDSGGTLHLDIAGAAVDVPVLNGRATIVLELHASATTEQRPPYFRDSRLAPFTIEVTV